MSDRSSTVTLSFLDAMSALWKPESVDMVEQAIRATLALLPSTTDVRVATSQIVPGGRGLYVSLFVHAYEGSAAGFSLALERTTLGLGMNVIGRPTIPEYLLFARVEVQPSWLASA